MPIACDTFLLLYMLVIFLVFGYIAFSTFLQSTVTRGDSVYDVAEYRSLAHCYSQSLSLNLILCSSHFFISGVNYSQA